MREILHNSEHLSNLFENEINNDDEKLVGEFNNYFDMGIYAALDKNLLFKILNDKSILPTLGDKELEKLVDMLKFLLYKDDNLFLGILTMIKYRNKYLKSKIKVLKYLLDEYNSIEVSPSLLITFVLGNMIDNFCIEIEKYKDEEGKVDPDLLDQIIRIIISRDYLELFEYFTKNFEFDNVLMMNLKKDSKIYNLYQDCETDQESIRKKIKLALLNRDKTNLNKYLNFDNTEKDADTIEFYLNFVISEDLGIDMLKFMINYFNLEYEANITELLLPSLFDKYKYSLLKYNFYPKYESILTKLPMREMTVSEEEDLKYSYYDYEFDIINFYIFII